MPGPLLSALQVLTHLILPIRHSRRNKCHPHFIDAGTEREGGVKIPKLVVVRFEFKTRQSDIRIHPPNCYVDMSI